MHYNKIITLKNSARCTLRNADFNDGASVLDVFLLTHAQTDNLLSYPEENTFSANDEAMYLKDKSDSHDEIEILAEIDSKVVGTAGISKIGKHAKVKHRADIGIAMGKNSMLILGRLANIISPSLAALLHNASTAAISMSTMRRID